MTELRKDSVDIGIYLIADPKRSQDLYFAGQTWGKFDVSLYYLKRDRAVVEALPPEKSLVGIRTNTVISKILHKASYSNIIAADSVDQIVKLLKMGRIHYYFDVDVLFHQSLDMLKLDKEQFVKKNLAVIKPGTYFSDRYRKFPKAISMWEARMEKCKKVGRSH